jgi:nucleoside-diphosphate-sugar epimerase
VNSKALVTGATGFIGSHLVDSLLADEIPVRALVEPNTDPSSLKDSQSEIVYGDIRDPDAMRRVMQGVETVYHLAAISRHDVNVPNSEYYAVNVDGTKNLLEAVRNTGVKRFLYTATIEAVGMSKDGSPLTEETPQSPRNIYGQTKLEGERLVRDYAASRGMNTVVVRPPMTYGPRETILCDRLFKVIRRHVYPLIGDGQALTEFCHVKNQVHGIRLAAERGRPGEVYFISDERSYTIEEIVRTIARVLGVRVITPHVPIPVALAVGLAFEVLSKVFRFYPFVIPQTGRPPFSRKTVAWTSESRLYCDISKARTELGYEPSLSLESGISETVQWYKEHGYLS